MARARKTRRSVADPLLRSCPACGARKGAGCNAIGKDSKPLVTWASRLVHATRLEGSTDA